MYMYSWDEFGLSPELVSVSSFDVITVNDQVIRAARIKKARMAGTRSDFLSRACSAELDSDEDEDRAVLPESPSDPDSDSQTVKLSPNAALHTDPFWSMTAESFLKEQFSQNVEFCH